MDARTRAMDFLREIGKPDDWPAIDKLTAVIQRGECELICEIEELRDEVRELESDTEWQQEWNSKLNDQNKTLMFLILLICMRKGEVNVRFAGTY